MAIQRGGEATLREITDLVLVPSYEDAIRPQMCDTLIGYSAICAIITARGNTHTKF